MDSSFHQPEMGWDVRNPHLPSFMEGQHCTMCLEEGKEVDEAHKSKGQLSFSASFCTGRGSPQGHELVNCSLTPGLTGDVTEQSYNQKPSSMGFMNDFWSIISVLHPVSRFTQSQRTCQQGSLFWYPWEGTGEAE